MMRKAAITVFATAFLAAGFLIPQVSAQDGMAAELEKAEEESFEPEHLEKAARLIRLTGAAEGFDDILPVIAEQTMTLFIRSNPSIGADIEEVTTTVAIDMAKRRRELNEVLHKVWARRFTPEEMDDLIAFFSSETGQKFAELTPVVTALSVGASKQWSDKIATDMVTEVRAGLRERGHNL
jgi:hypothetical protein